MRFAGAEAHEAVIRLYLSKMRGDGLTPETAFRAAFMDLLPKKPKKVAIGDKGGVALVVADTTTAEHDTLIASGEVFEVDKALLQTRRGDLTGAQRNKINSILTDMGFARASTVFTVDATVLDVVRWIRGSLSWAGERDLGV